MYYDNYRMSIVIVLQFRQVMKKTHRIGAALLLGCAAIVVGVSFVASKQQTAAEKYHRHRKEYCAGMRSFTPEQEKACEEEADSSGDYLPWGYKLVAWPEGIATWAFLATLGAIIWQAVETRRAARATADAASATYGSVAYAEAQFHLMKEKERGRLDIQPSTERALTIQYFGGEQKDSWYLSGTIRARNIGQSRSFIVDSAAKLVVKANGSDYPEYDVHGKINFADSFVDPDPLNAFAELNFSYSPEKEDKIRFLAEDLQASRRSINVYGVIDYGTLGMRFRREFGFVWVVIDPTWWLPSMAGPEGEITDERKVTFGYWAVDPEKDKPEYPIPNEEQKTV
jgi:hypothetical protein